MVLLTRGNTSGTGHNETHLLAHESVVSYGERSRAGAGTDTVRLCGLLLPRYFDWNFGMMLGDAQRLQPRRVGCQDEGAQR